MKRSTGILLTWLLTLAPTAAMAVTPVTTHASKGAPLTYSEMDSNFLNLRNATDGYAATLGAGLATLQAGQGAGMLGYATKAALDADLAHPAGATAIVTNDSTINNTFYLKLGAAGAGSWQKSALTFAMPQVNASLYTDFTTAVLAQGGNPAMLLVSAAGAVPLDLTVPATCGVTVLPGGTLSPASGKTLTINGPFRAEQRPVFAGAGAVVFGKGSTREILPQWFGALADGSSDDTAALQATINSALASYVRAIYLPAGLYKVNGSLTIQLTYSGMEHGAVSIRGEGRGNLQVSSIEAYGETVLLSGPGSTSPVLSVKGIQGTPDFIAGLSLENITFLGSDNMNSRTNAKDRQALYMELVARTWTLRNVRFCGFLRESLKLNRVYDGTVENCNFMFGGTDNVYPMVALDSSLGDNTNAVKFTDCHWEGSPYQLLVNNARGNFFSNCKFEIGTLGAGSTTGPLINITSVALEHVFSNCLFSNYQPYTTSYMFRIANGLTTLANSLFVSAGAAGDRWIMHSGAGLTVSHNTFNRAFSDAGNPPFVLNQFATFTENHVIAPITAAGLLAVVKLTGNYNTIRDNYIIDDTGRTANSGWVFNVGTTTGSRISGNFIGLNGAGGTYTSASGAGLANTVYELHSKGYSMDTISGTDPVVQGRSSFNVANPSPLNVGNFWGGSEGQTIRLVFADSNTTISDSGRFRLNGTFVSTAGDSLVLIQYGGIWYEISRSVN